MTKLVSVTCRFLFVLFSTASGPREPVAVASSESKSIKVSAGSTPTKIAGNMCRFLFVSQVLFCVIVFPWQGSIAHVTRAGEPPSVFAIGSSSINQALKGELGPAQNWLAVVWRVEILRYCGAGIIIARGYLEGDSIDLNIQACIHQETGRYVSVLFSQVSVAFHFRVCHATVSSSDAIEFELSKIGRRTPPA